jgi:hypothetical protein
MTIYLFKYEIWLDIQQLCKFDVGVLGMDVGFDVSAYGVWGMDG